MKSVVLFIIASLVVTLCAKLSSANDAGEPKNVGYDLLKMIKSLICPGNKLDVDSFVINKEIGQNFQNKSIQYMQKLYCSEESSTVSHNIIISDANKIMARSISQLNYGAVPDTITGNILTPNATKITKTVDNTNISQSIIQPVTNTKNISSVVTSVATEVTKSGSSTIILQSMVQPSSTVDTTTDNTILSSSVIPVATEVYIADAKTNIEQSTVLPDQIQVSGITNGSTQLSATEAPCQLLLVDPKICDIKCFMYKKLEFTKCITKLYIQYHKEWLYSITHA